jgi:4-hydroxy-tetrahydrodipicolinate synthase
MQERRHSVIAAVPTPFDAEGRLDVDGCWALFEHLSATDLDGYFVNGTAGEFMTMSASERREVARVAVEAIESGRRLIVHVGAPSSRQVIAHLDDMRELGVLEVSVMTPFLVSTSDDAILEFYRHVSDAADGLLLYPYLYRHLTGTFVSPRLLARIAELPHVAGAKITGELPDRLLEYASATPDGFRLYAGADRDLADALAHGAEGVISAMSGGLSAPFTRLARVLAAGIDPAEAQSEVDDVCAVLDGNIARTKAALRLQGVPVGWPRLPLVEPDAAATAEIARITAAYGVPPPAAS